MLYWQKIIWGTLKRDTINTGPRNWGLGTQKLGTHARTQSFEGCVALQQYHWYNYTANLCQCNKPKRTVMSCMSSLYTLKVLLTTNNAISKYRLTSLILSQSSLLSVLHTQSENCVTCWDYYARDLLPWDFCTPLAVMQRARSLAWNEGDSFSFTEWRQNERS